MSSVEELLGPEVGPADRLDALFDELAELTGQRNAIDGRIVEIAAEMEGRCLWGTTGARSLAATVAWKIGCSSGNAETNAAVAQRLEAFPLCAAGMREGRLSLDQVGVIAKNAAELGCPLRAAGQCGHGESVAHGGEIGTQTAQAQTGTADRYQQVHQR